MPNTPEHKVECFKAAVRLRRQGKPIWAETIDLSKFFHDESLPFKAIRDTTVQLIKASRWWQQRSKPVLDNQECLDCVEGLAQALDGDEFDMYWNEFYDLADRDRVWVKTF